MASIVDKVRKLLRLAQSDNVEEAASAAAKAQELIARYQLDAAILALDAESEPDEPIVDFGEGDDASPLDVAGVSKIPLWRQRLASRVSIINACRIYFNGGTIHIIGRPSDVETVRYLYAYLSREVARLAERDGAGRGASWRNDYRLGVVDTLRRRLAKAVTDAQAAARAEADRLSGPARETALVRIDRGLVRLQEREAAVIAFYDAQLTGVGARRTRGRITSTGGRLAGRKAGETIQIGGARGALGQPGRLALGPRR